MKSQLEQQKRAAGNRSAESEGPVSEEAYHRIRIALFGDRRAPYPERREGPGSADVPAWEHYSEISGAQRNEASKTQLDADRLAWTPEACSNASAIDAVSSDEGRLRGEAEAQVGSRFIDCGRQPSRERHDGYAGPQFSADSRGS